MASDAPSAVELRACVACGSGVDLWPYLNLGTQPLANAYRSDPIVLPASFPLQVNLCVNCGHSQLSLAVDPETIFRDYPYVSGTTATFRAHCAELAGDVWMRTNHPRRVLDIACNDGTLLEAFEDLGVGLEVFGVDPAHNLREITREKGFKVGARFWDHETARDAVELWGGRFHVITALNVLAHVRDPVAFLSAARDALEPDGLLVVEFPYGADQVRTTAFDQVYHEHVSYFLARSFGRVARRARLVIEDVVRTPIHGGSIRFYLRHPRARLELHAASFLRLIADEQEARLYDLAHYEGLARRIEERGAALGRLVAAARGADRHVVAYGAAAKGVVMLNAWARHGVRPDALVVDDNPLKQGRYLPHPVPFRVEAPAALAGEPDELAILVLAWNFREEIEQRLRAIRPRERGDTVLVHVPDVVEEPLWR
jgi:SAM-dependent methyltransferase